MDDKQQNFYKRLLINIRVKCLKQGITKSEFCLTQGRKISNICLKQGQSMRGRTAPPHPGIYRVPPPPRDVGKVFVHCKQKEGRTQRQYCSPVDIKMKCVYNYYVQSCVFMRQFRFRQSTTNRYRLISIIDTNR